MLVPAWAADTRGNILPFSSCDETRLEHVAWLGLVWFCFVLVGLVWFGSVWVGLVRFGVRFGSVGLGWFGCWFGWVGLVRFGLV